jgi:hypothetical protein
VCASVGTDTKHSSRVLRAPPNWVLRKAWRADSRVQGCRSQVVTDAWEATSFVTSSPVSKDPLQGKKENIFHHGEGARKCPRSLEKCSRQGHCTKSRDISGSHHWGGKGVLLTMGGYRWRLLLNTLQCTGQHELPARAWRQWLIPVMLTTWEAEIQGITVWG